MDTGTGSTSSGIFSRARFYAAGGCLCLGFFFALLSWLEVCVEHCSANKKFLLLGYPFAQFGLLFFGGLIVLHFISRSYPSLNLLLGVLVAGAMGAEVWFLSIQKFQVGHWCPLCVSIAASLLGAACLRGKEWFFQGGAYMGVQRFLCSAAMICGFLTAFFGVTHPNAAEAAVHEVRDQLAFGALDSPVEVYFITDWFCPACNKEEGCLEKVCPMIQSKARFTFVDFPVHRNSLNYTPYHLALATNHKQDYFTGRRALLNLTLKTEAPNDSEVHQALSKYGIQLKELNYLAVLAGIDYFDKVATKYKVSATPTVVITNQKSKETKILQGSTEISEKKIVEIIDAMNKK